MFWQKASAVAVFCWFILGSAPLASHAQSAAPAVKQDEVAAFQIPGFESIDLDSVDTEGFFSRKPVRIKGYLLKARRDARTPAAVLAPACNGLLSETGAQIRPQYRKMASLLNDLGITVLLVDGFNPRGFKEICTHAVKSRTIDVGVRMKDTLGGLAYLRSRDDVLADQIVMVTWGATGGFETMNKDLPEYQKSGSGFAAALMFYPHCTGVGSRFAPYAPIQMFVGDKDTWNPAAPCEALKRQQEAGSAPFDIRLYPDTYHGFDQPRPPSLRKDLAVGPVITGGNPESAADAYKTAEEFLSRLVKVTKLL